MQVAATFSSRKVIGRHRYIGMRCDWVESRGFANLKSQKRNCRRNLRNARMCPRYARASSSVPPVILRLASRATSIFAKRSSVNESALYRGNERVLQFSLGIRKNETWSAAFVAATLLFRNPLPRAARYQHIGF